VAISWYIPTLGICIAHAATTADGGGWTNTTTAVTSVEQSRCAITDNATLAFLDCQTTTYISEWKREIDRDGWASERVRDSARDREWESEREREREREREG
jgi:hypothetical protein